ncbi:MAG: PTS sugar transporter subunit IIA [Lentisphaerae bacterium]|nr:PTS sugar transporter subunit IIA [Lentisphaerota bacterium]
MNALPKNLSELLENGVFEPSLKAATKEGILAEITDALISNGKISESEREKVYRALVDREAKMSTGMQYGVAIPHARTDAVEELVTIVALAPRGVIFGSLDGALSTIFVGTLSPLDDANSHIRFLAEVSRRLSNRKIREELLGVKNKEELIATICGE